MGTIEIGCRYCVSERIKQLYGSRIGPIAAASTFRIVLDPVRLHPRDLNIANLKDPLTQNFLYFNVFNKTQFFRDMYMLRMAEKVVSGILENKLASSTERPKIRIWSMACSTGQEPYSLAMLIRQNGWQAKADFEILGTDIIARFLVFAAGGKGYVTDAQEGYVSHPGDPEIPAEYRSFIKESNGRVDIRPEVRAMVKFRLANILDPKDYSGLQEIDLILANDVFCYFDGEDVNKILRLAAPALSPNGAVIGKWLTDEIVAESGAPLKRLGFPDQLEMVVNGSERMYQNGADYRAYQRSA